MKVFTCGVFDMFHVGHLNFLQEAAVEGPLTVGVQDDRDVLVGKGKAPVVPLLDRIAIVSALKCVDRVISYRNVDQSELFTQLRPDVFVVGEEYGRDTRFPLQRMTLSFCEEFGIKVVRVPRTDGVSTTLLRESANDFWENLAETHFESAKESITTLSQENPEQTNDEARKILHLLPRPWDNVRLLDLGAGDGRLTLKLVDHLKSIVAVEKQNVLLHRLRMHLSESQKQKVQCIAKDAIAFIRDKNYPYHYGPVLLSGICPYLSNEEWREVCVDYINRQDIIFREPLSTTGKDIQVVKQQSTFGEYSAIYRTPYNLLAFLPQYRQIHFEKLYQHHQDTAMFLISVKHGRVD